jgi:Ca-activated chloride channel family protein
MNIVVERFGLATLLLCGAVPTLLAQSRDAQFHADANVVLINATILDRHERPVRGLTRDSFHVLEDGSEQIITYFGEEDVPISLAVLLDVSGSMDRKIAGARQALSAVLSGPNEGDEFSLITFAEHPRVTVPWTTAAAEIENSVLMDQAHGRTSLLDAIALGIRQLRQSKNPRRALVVLSDGGDNFSSYTERQLSSMLDEADVQMYAIEMSDTAFLPEESAEVSAGPDLLSRLCGRTGGRYLQVQTGRQLAVAADQLGKELRSQYVLGYAPPKGSADGKFHHVRLQVTRPPGSPKLSVYWRQGYRAPPE